MIIRLYYSMFIKKRNNLRPLFTRMRNVAVINSFRVQKSFAAFLEINTFKQHLKWLRHFQTIPDNMNIKLAFGWILAACLLLLYKRRN